MSSSQNVEEKEIEHEPEKQTIDLQLSDVIRIEAPSNQILNNNTFIIGLCNKCNCTKKELFYKLLRKNTEEFSQIEINRASLYFQLKV